MSKLKSLTNEKPGKFVPDGFISLNLLMSRVISADYNEDDSISPLSRKVMREISGLDEDEDEPKTETLTTLGRFHVELIGAYFSAGTYTVVYFNNDPLNVEETPAEIDIKINECYEQGSKNKVN